MALLAGYGLSQIKWVHVRMTILCLVVIEGLANQQQTGPGHHERSRESTGIVFCTQERLECPQ